MLSVSLRCPKDATLPYEATHSCHLQSESFMIVDEESTFAEQQTSEIGHIALTI